MNAMSALFDSNSVLVTAFILIFIYIKFMVLFCWCRKYCCPNTKQHTTSITTVDGNRYGDFPRNEASPVVVPPYPVDARHPTPQTNSGIGFGGSNPPYPTHTPHPIPTAVPLYYPPPMGIAPYPPTPGPTPYPPTSPPVSSSAPFPDYSGSPPSYSEAVAHAPVQPPKLEQEAFGKQAPYNPNY